MIVTSPNGPKFFSLFLISLFLLFQVNFIFNLFVDCNNNHFFLDNIDKDFWNRVAHYTGAGSGVRYLEGWILAFIAFDKEGIYFLNNMKDIKLSHKFGRMVSPRYFPYVYCIFIIR